MQLACYRFRDIGGVSSARLSLDRRTIVVASPECLIHGALMSDAKLTRSVLFYSRTFDEESTVTTATISTNGKFVVGLDNGNVAVYEQIPTGTLGRNFRLLSCPNVRDRLPVWRVEWIGARSLIVVCRHGYFPTCRLIWWNIDREDVPCLNIEKNNINSWCLLEPEQKVFWTSGESVCCTGWTIKAFDSAFVSKILIYGEHILAASLFDSNEIVIINPQTGAIVRRLTIGSANLTCLRTSVNGQYCLVADEAGQAYLIRTRNWSITPLESPSLIKIKDLDGNETIIIVLGEDSLRIYDALSLELLREQRIPDKMRRMRGADLDFTGHLQAEILSLDEDGRILVRWGNRAIQLWNFGKRISQMDKARRSSEDKQGGRLSKAQITRDMKEDLSAYADELEEVAEKKRILNEYAVEGMSEAEMLQYARLMSMEANQFTGTDGVSSRGRSPTNSIVSDDEEFKLALQLSLIEH